jgi:hypothetical protein
VHVDGLGHTPDLTRLACGRRPARQVYFGVEMVVKVWGLGAGPYCSENMNLFDAVVTIAGLVEMGINLSPTAGAMGSYLSVLRAFRLLRVLRLARSWKSLNRIIKIALRSFAAVAWLTALLLLAMFIWGLLGMQFFGFQLARCSIPGAKQLCPPGLDVLDDCPEVWECYMPCGEAQVGSWFPVDGSPYGGQAYCERFPRASSPSSAAPEYWAQLGQADLPRANYDDMFHAFITTFQVCAPCVRAVVGGGPWRLPGRQLRNCLSLLRCMRHVCTCAWAEPG